MKKAAIIAALGVLALGIVSVASILIWGLSVYNSNIGMEQKILAVDQQNKNNLSSLTLRVKEMAQVPDMAVAGLVKVAESAIKGRYGADGSKAVFQFIQEQNPNLDQGMYTQIMKTIETGRKDFEREQKQKIDVCREYTTIISKAPRSFVSGLLGFPRIDIDPNSKNESAPCRILVAGEVNEKFKTGVDDVIKVK